MKKRIEYTDEPMTIGRVVSRDILPGHGGARSGAGRPPSGKSPLTLRLPPKLIEVVRRQARKAGQSVSDFVAAKLQGS